MMIVNHVGVKTLAASQVEHGLGETLLFIGSFAPVMFFSVTGIGYGIQANRKKRTSHWPSILNKVAILLVADLVMQWENGRLWGLDFLGFIGLSVLLLEVLRKTKTPLIYCLAGISAITLLRYGLAPKLKLLGYEQYPPLLNWVLGTTDVAGVSYPLSPWIVYPLLGYVVGATAVRYWSYIERHRPLVTASLLGLSILPVAASVFLAQRGGSFFRWGTVSLGFYIASFAALLLGFALALSISGGLKKTYQRVLSLRGVASLAVVPIHYFFVGLVYQIGAKDLNLSAFVVLTVVILVMSFLIARLIENISQRLHTINKQNLLWLGLVLILLLSASVTLTYGGENTALALFSTTLGQVILCLLLSVRLPFQQTA